ncbi:M20/M25/M40 family metallo-hydrolase [Candidatus Formimonas warabiya]|uniref:M20/M25/M40 family metallo-hydrolase n=1 Tax=Formimonas warabiya TaxID=1761012 RepID=UPI001BE3E114|nr:M20/M25/M40 family metallo-hydrolase [Candidatus Formimonas warabiya]
MKREIVAAEYLKKQLAEVGIEAGIVEPLAGKGSMIAFLPGTGSLPPLLLLSHLDTADWQEADWSYPPLSGQFCADSIWGRGAIDCKGLTSVWLTIFKLIKILGLIPQRTIIFAATADEESGGYWGTQWILEHTTLLKNIGYVLSEGGGYAVKFGKRKFFTCQTGEKGLIQVKASQAAGIKKTLRQELRYPHSPSREMFVKNVLSGQNVIYRLLSLHPLWREKILSWLQDRNVSKMDIHAFLSPIINCAGDSPSTRWLRISPRVNEQHLRDLCLEWESCCIFEPPTESSLDTELFQLIQTVTKEDHPSSDILPYITPGYSDNRFFRKRGIPTYGFFPLDDLSPITTMHQANERICVPSLVKSVRILLSLIQRFAL